MKYKDMTTELIIVSICRLCQSEKLTKKQAKALQDLTEELQKRNIVADTQAFLNNVFYKA